MRQYLLFVFFSLLSFKGMPYTIYRFLDTSKTAVFSDREQFKWQKESETIILNLYTDKPCWIKIDLDSLDHKDFVCLSHPNIYEIEFYAIKSNGEMDSCTTGIKYPFKKRPFNARNFVYPIDKETKSLYIKAKMNYGVLYLPLSLYSYEEFFELEQKNDFFYFIIIGLNLGFLLISLMVYFGLRNRLYLLYSAYVFCILLMNLTQKGYAYQYIWADLPMIQQRSRGIWQILILVFSLLFTLNVLKLSENGYKKIEKAYKCFVFFYLALLLVFLLPIDTPYRFTSFVVQTMHVCSIACSVFIWLSATFLAFRGVKMAKMLVLSFLPMIFIYLKIQFASYGYFPNWAFDAKLLSVALCIELVFWLIIIGKNVLDEWKEKQILQSKLLVLESSLQLKGDKNSPTIKEKTEDPDLDIIHQTLMEKMETEKVYLDPDISLQSLADKLNIHSHKLSQTINQKEQMHFFDYINLHRIAYAKKMLLSEKYNHLSIEGIAYEVGFNNKSSFNRFFKKFTNLTPSEYKKLDA